MLKLTQLALCVINTHRQTHTSSVFFTQSTLSDISTIFLPCVLPPFLFFPSTFPTHPRLPFIHHSSLPSFLPTVVLPSNFHSPLHHYARHFPSNTHRYTHTHSLFYAHFFSASPWLLDNQERGTKYVLIIHKCNQQYVIHYCPSLLCMTIKVYVWPCQNSFKSIISPLLPLPALSLPFEITSFPFLAFLLSVLFPRLFFYFQFFTPLSLFCSVSSYYLSPLPLPFFKVNCTSTNCAVSGPPFLLGEDWE